MTKFYDVRERLLSALEEAGGLWKKVKNSELKREIEELSVPGFDARSEKIWAILTETSERPKCACGKNTGFLGMRDGYRKFCSTKCMANSEEIRNKAKSTMKSKYGHEHWTRSDHGAAIRKEQISRLGKLPGSFGAEEYKAGVRKKYGVDNVFASEQIKEKIKSTHLKLRGVDNPSKSPEVKNRAVTTAAAKYGQVFNREKVKDTLKSRYGVDNPSKSPEIFEKTKATTLKRYSGFFNPEKTKITNLSRYGGITPMSDPAIAKKSSKTKRNKFILQKIEKLKNVVLPNFNLSEFAGCDETYSWTCAKCGNEFDDNLADGHVPVCRRCYPLNFGTSSGEKELADFVESIYSGKIITNTRSVITPLELDIYLPEISVAIEFDGLYWHSELAGKSKNYHLDKTTACEEKNIELIHVFESDWLFKNHVVKSRLSNALGSKIRKIHARKCNVKTINLKERREFFEKNHLQGDCKCSVAIGLFDADKLVAAMSFGKPRFNKNYQWEMIRFCSGSDELVVGASSKLFKYFVDNFDVESAISYADRRWGAGSVYSNLGFKNVGTSAPNYFYFKSFNLEPRMKFQKHKLPKLLENFDPNLSEWENMQANGWNRIWDCGNFVWSWRR